MKISLWTKRAEKKFDKIIEYLLTDWNEQVTEKFVKKVYDFINTLADFPEMIKKGIPVKGAKALMLGITFKENCPDIRNTKAIDIYHELREYGMEVDVYDPWANPADVQHEYNINILSELPPFGGTEGGFGAIILAVAHLEFMKINLQQHKNVGSIIYDVKGILNQVIIDGRL